MPGRSVEHLMSDVAFALEQGLSARDLVPMLRQLAEKAPKGSETSRFARICLGRQLLSVQPFQAAVLSRALTREDPLDDEAWGLYGLSLTVLGHYATAKKALERACSLAPEHPGHAHNLGHLLDAALERPLCAIPLLRRALDAAPEVPSIASSYAHALWRVGRTASALEALRQHAGMDASTAQATLEQWREGGTGDR
ncbi:MAG: tetratricopeptide repeat protein [Polyangiaceae bacterium]